jgi:hypothetical protein
MTKGRKPISSNGRNGQAKRNSKSSASASPVENLLLEALETELGGVEVYQAALECVLRDDLREEWEKYLDQTKQHVVAMNELCEVFGVDATRDTPGRQVVRLIGKSLVKAMNLALGSAEPAAAECVAAECVVLAETKDHKNWHAMKAVAKKLEGDEARALKSACERYEDEEDEHLYHTQGWARELTAKGLGLPAKLPPAEETADVKSELEAVRARGRS